MRPVAIFTFQAIRKPPASRAVNSATVLADTEATPAPGNIGRLRG